MEAARTWLPRGLGTLAFLWYALAAAPGFYWLDSAELSASALGMGAPHATGFPLYMLLGKFASLLPIGELAFRMNLLSAACAALAVGGVAELVLRLGKKDWATVAGACAGGAALAVSLLFARHATIAEVYAPTAAFLVLTLLLFERVVQGGTASVGLSLAWVAGLGLGMHPSFRLLTVLPILALLGLRLYRGARWPLLAPVVSTLSGAALYLYLPVRSATGRIASLDWGHPDTLANTWAHANATEFRQTFADRMMSGQGEIVWQDIKTFAQQIGDHLGLLCVVAACAGMALLWWERKSRWVAGSLMTMALVDAAYGSWIHPMGLVDFQNGVPLSLIACICAGVAVAALARLTGPAAPFVGAVAVLALVLPSAMVTMPAVAGVGDLPRDASEEGLQVAAPGSVLLSQSDSIAAGTTYLASVEGARPDLAILALPMLPDHERVADQLKRSGSAVDLRHKKDNALAAILSTGRRIYWENGSIGIPTGKSLRQGALVSELVDQEPPRESLRGSLSRLTRIFHVPGRRDRVARRVLANALTNTGRAAFGQGELELSRDIFASAIELRPEHAAARVNLGVIYSRTGDLEAAIQTTERALQDEPNRHGALVNAARYRLALDQLQEAEAHAERALRVSPGKASAWTMAALVDIKKERVERARARLERALELAPDHAEARAALEGL